MYQAQNKLLRIDDLEIDYIRFGQGQKPLVLIPGLSLSRLRGKAWQLSFMYRIFAKDYSVYLFDRKNHIAAGYQIEDMATDLARAMDDLNIEDADIVGISQGGMIAQILAIDYPRLVHKLVLGVTLARQNATFQSTIGHWLFLAQKGDLKHLILDMFNKVYSDAYVQKHTFLIHLLARFARSQELERFIILAKACLAFDVYDELSAITCPTFVLGGQRDKVVSGQASRELADRLVCPSYLYQNLGHSAYIEAKDFNQIIFDFLQKD